MKEKINQTLDLIRPYLAMDGGNIEYIDFKEGTAYIRLTENCQDCEYANATISEYIEIVLKEEIPEIKQVINVPL